MGGGLEGGDDLGGVLYLDTIGTLSRAIHGGMPNNVNEAYVESRANNMASPKWQQHGQTLFD